jgi:HPt (histidine-containing phosphotransfer) domain-containing protein
MSAMVPPDVLDVSVLHRLRALQGEGEPDIVADVAGVFLADVPGRLQQIRAAIEGGDQATAERLTHSLKSSAAMLGAKGLSRIASELESRARDGGVPRGDPQVAELEEAFTRTREALALLGLA